MPYSREQILQMHHAARVYQERYDEAFQPWGMRAPEPTIGGDVGDYRRNLAVKAKRLLPDGHEFRRVQFRALADDVLNNFEPQLIKECGAAASRNDSVPPGEMRCVEKVNPHNGHKEKVFYGRECFVKDMMRPGRGVVSFRTDQGYIDASGRGLR